MFTLFTVKVHELGRPGFYVDAVRTASGPRLPGNGGLVPGMLYRIPEAGWFAYCPADEPGQVVLYFKLDDGTGTCLAVAESGTYRFGRIIENFYASARGFHEGQWHESEAGWGWLKPDEEEPTFEVPEFVREQLAAAAGS